MPDHPYQPPRWTPLMRMQRQMRAYQDQLSRATTPAQARSLRQRIAELAATIEKEEHSHADDGHRA